MRRKKFEVSPFWQHPTGDSFWGKSSGPSACYLLIHWFVITPVRAPPSYGPPSFGPPVETEGYYWATLTELYIKRTPIQFEVIDRQLRRSFP